MVKGANMVAVSVGDQDVRDIRPCGTGLTQRRIQSQAARIHTCVDQDDTTRIGHQIRTHVKLDRLGTQRARRDAMPHQGAPCAHVATAMALRATLECDLPRQDLGTYQEDGEDRNHYAAFRS